MNEPDRRPGLTEEDAALWRGVMKDTAPLHGRAADRKPPPDAPARTGAAPQAQVSRRGSAAAAAPGGVDRRTQQRLRRGQIPIDSRLDLHGMTRSQAHDALTRGLAAAQAHGERCVLVITGKGEIDGERGVLRRSAPRWLGEGENAARVLDMAPARARDGGAGAFYVYLRKARR